MNKNSLKIGACIAVFVLIFSIIGVVFYSTMEQSNKTVTIENNKLSIIFRNDDYTPIKICDKEKGAEIEFADSQLWRIIVINIPKMKNSDNPSKDVFSESSSTDSIWKKKYYIRNLEKEKVLHLVWKNKKYGEITVNINLSDDEYLSTWNITIKNSNKNFAIWYVDFPHLCVKPRGGKNDYLLALPVNAGALIPNPFDNIHWKVAPWDEIRTDLWRAGWIDTMGSYPGNYNAQFAALYNKEGEGLYFASYDGNMYSKRFLFDGNGEILDLSIRNYPEHMLTPGVDYNIPYVFKIGIFHGDWMNAADIYKEWATKQIWCQKGPIYKWNDLSKSVYDIDLTTIAAYRITLDTPVHYPEIKEDLLAMKEFFDKYASVNNSTPKIGVHWIGWSKYLDVVNANSGFPNYLPPQENFTKLIDELKSTGSFYNDVYLTSHGSDIDTPYSKDDKYRWEDYKKYACYNPLGQPYRKFEPNLAWMDPSQKGWQDIEIEVSNETQKTCNLDGIYYDWYPKFRLDFNHHEGGGNYFAKGYREEISRIRNAIRETNPNFYCCPEGKSEIEVGVFDAMLMEWFWSDEKGIVHSYANIGIPIPLISYLYHEYIGMAGGIRIHNKDFTGFNNPDDFRLVSAIIWAWGNKPQYPFVDGRKSNEYVFTEWKEGKLNRTWENNLIYLANLVKMYKKGKDALFLGRMLCPPEIEGEHKVTVNLGGNTVNVPKLIVSAFGAPDGEIYIPVTNWGHQRETITGIDFSKCEWINKSFSMTVIRDNSTTVLGEFNKDSVSINIPVDAGEAIFIVISNE